MKQRVLSGIRATGKLHLGNYLGAVKGMVELQNKGEYDTIFMVADLHSITTPYDKKELSISRKDIFVDYLSAGIDPDKSIIFIQSDIPELLELTYFFSTIVSIKRMQHLPTFKDKVKQHPHNVTMALLNYPVLQAADILIYKASLVPVGIDQEPHLEIAREIARKMNGLYCTNFPEPIRFKTEGEYVPSLKGEGKMSKTIEGSYINMSDSLDEIRKIIRSVQTADKSGGEMSEGLKALFTIFDLFDPATCDKYKKLYDNGTLQFVELKDNLAEVIYREIGTFQKRRGEIVRDESFIIKCMKEGSEKARYLAKQTVNEVREKMGI